MTSLIMAAICTFISPYAQLVSIEARYLHEWPPSQTYVYTGIGLAQQGQCVVEAEGVPYYIKVAADGELLEQCTYDPAIFVDGFEFGDVREWK